LEDPSPTPSRDIYSEEFCSFVDACLQKDADARPTCDEVKWRVLQFIFLKIKKVAGLLLHKFPEKFIYAVPSPDLRKAAASCTGASLFSIGFWDSM
jgi:hypothetical protein